MNINFSEMRVQLIDKMGHDVRVTDIARQSFNTDIGATVRDKADLTEKDISLINYLGSGYQNSERAELVATVMAGTPHSHEAQNVIDSIKHHATHWVPFAHCMVTIACTAPLSVVRQLYKTKVGLVESEVSRRYVDSLPDVFDVKEFRSRPSGSIKQGSGDVHHNNESWLKYYESHMQNSLLLYESMIKDGVAPEQARFVLPQSMMVDWTWTGSLYVLAHLYNLRIDPHVQEETRHFIQMVADTVSPLFPNSWDALTRHDVSL